MKYIQFCPMEKSLEEAIQLAGDKLVPGVICRVSGQLVYVEKVTANNLIISGDDSYLYQINSEGVSKLIDQGIGD